MTMGRQNDLGIRRVGNKTMSDPGRNPNRPVHRPRRGKLSARAIVSFVFLLLIPTVAIERLARFVFEPRFVFGYLGGIWCITLWLYWHDKRQAESGGWRTPEATLHLLELLGGWPVAFLAQRTLRHKICKTGYQVGFWLIVLGHEAVSFDFVLNWRYSEAAIRFLFA